MFTPEEASGMLGIKPRQLKEMARQGKIPAVKVGKFWRFSEEALENWIWSQGNLSLNYEPDFDSIIGEN